MENSGLTNCYPAEKWSKSCCLSTFRNNAWNSDLGDLFLPQINFHIFWRWAEEFVTKPRVVVKAHLQIRINNAKWNILFLFFSEQTILFFASGLPWKWKIESVDGIWVRYPLLFSKRKTCIFSQISWGSFRAVCETINLNQKYLISLHETAG